MRAFDITEQQAERLARFYFPLILEFYDSEEGQKLWKEYKEQNGESKHEQDDKNKR